MIIGILSILLWLLIVPYAVGAVPAYLLDKGQKYKLLPLLAGYICVWAVFQFLCVPFILAQSRWELEHAFIKVVWSFGAVILLLSIAGIFFWRKTVGKLALHGKNFSLKKGGKSTVLWIIFACALLAQIVAMAFLAFADGDDAFYMAVASITEESNTMYLKLPYTGGTSLLDIRYGLAPMPVWIAFLSRVSGIHTAAMAQVVIPIVLLLVTYGIYGTIGQILCKDKKEMLPVYMIGISLLTTFGNYSFKTSETFLMTRTSQGKSILGNIILPFLFLLFFLLIERIKEKKTAEPMLWILFAATAAAACLCSTLGGALVIMLSMISGFFMGISFRKPAVIFHLLGSCLPALVCIVLYLWLH